MSQTPWTEFLSHRHSIALDSSDEPLYQRLDRESLTKNLMFVRKI